MKGQKAMVRMGEGGVSEKTPGVAKGHGPGRPPRPSRRLGHLLSQPLILLFLILLLPLHASGSQRILSFGDRVTAISKPNESFVAIAGGVTTH